MALVKFGGGVASISGKIDGTVYARNKAGAIARGWTKPNNPQTEAQQQARAIFGTAAGFWNEITLNQQDEWNALAQTVTRKNRQGDTYIPTGRQIFLEVNVGALSNGLASIQNAPADLNPPAIGEGLPTVDLEVTTGNITGFDVSVLPGGSFDRVIYYATPPLTNTRTNVKNLYRKITSLGAGDPQDLLAPYTAIFGTGIAMTNIIGMRMLFCWDSNAVLTSPIDFFAVPSAP